MQSHTKNDYRNRIESNGNKFPLCDVDKKNANGENSNEIV